MGEQDRHARRALQSFDDVCAALVEIDPQLCVALQAAARSQKISSPADLLAMPAADVAAITGLGSTRAAMDLVAHVADTVLAPQPVTAASLAPADTLTTGCPGIDAALGGGLQQGGITEVAGESAAGKTQLCMQLCACALLPRERGGLGSAALYVWAEGGEFPLARYAQIATARRPPPDLDLLARLHVLRVTSHQQLAFALSKQVPEFVAANDVGIVVIDSMAALFRYEYGRDDAAERAAALWSHARTLSRLASDRHVHVVVANQVTDLVRDDGEQCPFTVADADAGCEAEPRLSSRRVVPSLGLGWANCVTTRLQLSRTGLSVQAEATGVPAVVRKLQVVFSPWLPNVTVPCVVDSTGLRHVDIPGLP
eukprot:m51a1_g8664 putative x-ray repair cross complementing 3 isoform 1 (369) ;mRNA; r:92785-94157